MSKQTTLGLALLFVLASPAAFADDLTGQDRLLCSAGTVTVCSEEGECIKGSPFDFNVPQFVEVDLAARRLSSTEASGEDRSTDIKTLTRTDDYILLQGVDKGRGFSWMIDSLTGLVTVAIAVDGFNVGIFGACTPMPVSR